MLRCGRIPNKSGRHSSHEEVKPDSPQVWTAYNGFPPKITKWKWGEKRVNLWLENVRNTNSVRYSESVTSV